VIALLLLFIAILIDGYNSIELQNCKLWSIALARCNIGSCIGPIVNCCYSLSSSKPLSLRFVLTLSTNCH